MNISHGKNVEGQMESVKGLKLQGILREKSEIGWTAAKVLPSKKIEKGRVIDEERLRVGQAKAEAERVTNV